MDKETLIFSLKNNRLSHDEFLDIQSKIETMSEEKFKSFQAQFANIKLFNPNTTLFISILSPFIVFIFMLGIDRLLIKDFLIAFLRFVLIIVSYVVVGALTGMSQSPAPLYVFVAAYFIYAIAEIFLIYKKAQRKNYDKIMKVIAFA